MTLPYAEDVNYWQTSKTSPDTWIARTRTQIEKIGGKVLAEGFGSEPASGRSAYMLGFDLAGDRFKVVWPVLPNDNERSARIQAATMLFHDVKARCISSLVLGSRAAFFSYLLLPDGRTASEATVPELSSAIPALLTGKIVVLTDGRD